MITVWGQKTGHFNSYRNSSAEELGDILQKLYFFPNTSMFSLPNALLLQIKASPDTYIKAQIAPNEYPIVN